MRFLPSPIPYILINRQEEKQLKYTYSRQRSTAFSSLVEKKTEASPLNLKSHNNHSRSNSLPSKPHPIILQCNEHLATLGGASSDATSYSSLFSHKLNGLHGLHNCVEKLVQLPLTQEALVHECQEKWVEELLDGSLTLLDTWTTIKDALLHTKECTRELQSIIRRRGGEGELTIEVKKFLTSRKVIRKTIFKALENLRTNYANKCSFSICNKDYQTMALVSLLKEVEVITFSIFESLLNFISGSTQGKRSSWSLVSKIMQSKRVTYSQGVDENEFANLDAALQFCAINMANKSNDIDELQNRLARLGSCIQDLEEGLQSLFRCLIRITN